MTVLSLSLTIAAALFLQIAAFAMLAFYRHWQAYQDLRSRLSEMPGSYVEPYAGVEERPRPQPEAGWQGGRDFRVERKVFEDAACSICSFYLKPVDGAALPTFRPGQYLTFRLEVADASTGEQQQLVRCYSLSDRPGLDYYRISVKRVPASRPDFAPGRVSGHLHDRITEGSVLEVRAPSGHFHLDPAPGPVVLIAGGIGLTPMLSMVNATLAAASRREIWLFYGVRNGSEHAMKQHLAELAERHENFELHVCYSNPGPDDVEGRDYQHEGRVDIARLRLTLPLKPFHFYICGPTAMMEALVPALEEWGVPDRSIHYEAFGPASIMRTERAQEQPAVGADRPPVSVTFAKSGKSLTWDRSARSLLDFAEENGIAVNSGCRAGGCGCCQTEIIDGEVAYSQAPDFDPEPGSCLLCVSRPETNLVLSA